MQSRKTTVHFETDLGHDDVIAAMVLASDPNYDIASITVAGTGLAHGPEGAKNMANLCNMLGMPEVPIAYGPDTPCGKAFPFSELWRNATDKMLDAQNVPSHPNPIITDDPVALLKQTLLKNEKVTIIATGPLTNIARFFLKYKDDKDLISKIESIVIMGGAIKTKGNMSVDPTYADNTVGEFNIANDAKAAEIVFASGIEITLVPLDVTNLIPLSKEFYKSLSQESHPSLKLTFGLLKAIVELHGAEKFHEHFFLWDPLVIEIIRNPSLAKIENLFLKIDLDTGQTVQVNSHVQGSFKINVATDLTLTPKQILDNLIKQIRSRPLTVTPTASRFRLFQTDESKSTGPTVVDATETRPLTLGLK